MLSVREIVNMSYLEKRLQLHILITRGALRLLISFLLAYEGHWTEHSYDRWITVQLEEGATINSV
jgi:hypothetical protein